MFGIEDFIFILFNGFFCHVLLVLNYEQEVTDTCEPHA